MKKKYALFLFLSMIYLGLNAQITLTQSINPILVDNSGTACTDNTDPKQYNQNSFFRVYKLSDFSVAGNFEITSLEFGQGSADVGKNLTLNIYTADTDDLTNATLSPVLGSTTHTCTAATNTLISKPFSLVISSGSIIVFEILAPSGALASSKFYLGINNDGENDDSYLQAGDCIAFTNRTALSSVGLGAEHYVMNIIGNDVPLSVGENELTKISIGPNPTSDFVHVRLHPSNSIQRMELYSITGRKILDLDKNPEINLKNFSQGIYLLKVVTEYGTSTKRIIKK